jgi:hypothetical protein
VMIQSGKPLLGRLTVDGTGFLGHPVAALSTRRAGVAAAIRRAALRCH